MRHPDGDFRECGGDWLPEHALLAPISRFLLVKSSVRSTLVKSSVRSTLVTSIEQLTLVRFIEQLTVVKSIEQLWRRLLPLQMNQSRRPDRAAPEDVPPVAIDSTSSNKWRRK